MTDSTPRVVIIGACHAGGTAAAELRRSAFTGPITLPQSRMASPLRATAASLRGAQPP